MRANLLASLGLATPFCPVFAIDDNAEGWTQFGFFGVALFSSMAIIKKFMDRSLDQQERLVTSTIEQQKAQTTVLVGINDEIRQARFATAALDARITKHMDDDEQRTKELVDEIRAAFRRRGENKQ